MTTKYFLIKHKHRDCTLSTLVEEEHYVMFEEGYLENEVKNILGLPNEIPRLEITKIDGEYVAKDKTGPTFTFDHSLNSYEIVKELTKDEIDHIKRQNPDKVKAVQDYETDQHEFELDQIRQWEDFFNQSAKELNTLRQKGTGMFFDEDGDLAEYKNHKKIRKI